MAHLSEYAAVRRGDALYGADGSVGIIADIHGGISLQVCVLGGDLSVFRKPADQLLGGQETALSMGDGNVIYLTRLCVDEPGGLVGGDPGADDLGLVSGNGIEGKGGTILIRIHDLAIGNQPQLDQCLETVADTAHEAVPLGKELHDSLPDPLVAEEGGNELGGTVRLISSGETSGDKDDLAVSDLLCHCIHGFPDILCREIPDHHDLRIKSCVGNCLCTVIFAVGSRECRDQDLRCGMLYEGLRPLLCLIDEGLFLGALSRRSFRAHVAAEDLLQTVLVILQKSVKGKALSVIADLSALIGGAQIPYLKAAFLYGVAVIDEICGLRLVCLHNEGAIGIAEDVLHGQTLRKAEADHVSEALLHNGLCGASHAGGVNGKELSVADRLVDRPVKGLQGADLRQTVFQILRSQPENSASGVLELRRDDIPCLFRGDGKGNKGGRYIQLFKASAHTVLSANGCDLQIQLCGEGTQKST